MEVLGLIDIPTWLQWIILLIGLLVTYTVYMSWDHNTFKKMGIQGPKPEPIFGNMRMFMKDGLVKAEQDMYRKYGKVFGMYETYIPVLYIADPVLLKDILVKDFKNFVNRRNTFAKFTSPALRKMLTQIEDDHWRFVRNIITPTFSGKKLRLMTPLINRAADTFMENIEKKIKEDEDIDMKKFIGGFTMDVIATTAFGLDVDSQNNPNDPFTENAQAYSDPKSLAFIVIIVSGASAFFKRVTEKAMKERRKSPGEYHDFLGIMVNAEAGNEKSEQEETVTAPEGDSVNQSALTSNTLTEDHVTAQAILFFLAGYDTTANTLSFLIYHLAIYPEVCDRLLLEIDETLQGESPNYDNVANLSYMEMCIHETMRLFPVAARIDRMASNDVTIGNIKIPKGMIINIPVGAIQRDPEYWPDPEKFDPERFTPEAKAGRDPYVFLPFGTGPRNCVGMRLAILEMKIAVIRILQKYRPVKCTKTEVPIQVSNLGNVPKGLFLKFERR
ncbi:cytochrome P450 3A24-like isoform X2 [Ylistrum balloti]|uniref:cytochrome P450 3A24-like isoform X2 n=1 Tax=Ylistrum balloti TaxID=509963 RepID=UPI002905F45D|nr:cytochrome P450 3A24-like isoform X2 [Ylistrum balloti]